MRSPHGILCNTRNTCSKLKLQWLIEMNPLRGGVLLVAIFFAADVVAGSLEITVKDDKGSPLSDAVVYATGGTAAPPRKAAVIDQRDKQFVPYVTALQAGTALGVERAPGGAGAKGRHRRRHEGFGIHVAAQARRPRETRTRLNYRRLSLKFRSFRSRLLFFLVALLTLLQCATYLVVRRA